MVHHGHLTRSALVAAVLLAVIHFGSADKLAKCCTRVSNSMIPEPITGYMVQKRHAPCVLAVIIQTATGVYCINVRAPWVRARIAAFEKAKREATTISEAPSAATPILSTTATATSTSTATASPTSFPPTSQIVADETFVENQSE